MEEAPRKRGDRYDVSGSVEAQYVGAAGLVMVNKRGVTDLATLQDLEQQALARAYETLLREIRTDTPMSCDLLRHIHLEIFGELYEWAGRWRTVWISKPGITWPAPDFLERHMAAWQQNVLCKCPASALRNDEAFCEAVAEIHGEFLVVHPFREGNARAIKLMTDLLAAQTNRPLLAYDQSEAGQGQYVRAALAAFKKDYAPMREVIRSALIAARKP